MLGESRLSWGGGDGARQGLEEAWLLVQNPTLASWTPWGDLAGSLEHFGPGREFGGTLKTPKELLGTLPEMEGRQKGWEGVAAWVSDCGILGETVVC